MKISPGDVVAVIQVTKPYVKLGDYVSRLDSWLDIDDRLLVVAATNASCCVMSSKNTVGWVHTSWVRKIFDCE